MRPNPNGCLTILGVILGVDPEWQRRGTGEASMRPVFKAAERNGITQSVRCVGNDCDHWPNAANAGSALSTIASDVAVPHGVLLYRVGHRPRRVVNADVWFLPKRRCRDWGFIARLGVRCGSSIPDRAAERDFRFRAECRHRFANWSRRNSATSGTPFGKIVRRRPATDGQPRRALNKVADGSSPN
jgi:hypothetical protein